MKKFFQDVKADIKFKSAGPGQKLTESVRAHPCLEPVPLPSPHGDH